MTNFRYTTHNASATHLDASELGFPPGHRFGYVHRRDLLTPKGAMDKAKCSCKWNDDQWVHGKKAARMRWVRVHITAIKAQGQMFDEVGGY